MNRLSAHYEAIKKDFLPLVDAYVSDVTTVIEGSGHRHAPYMYEIVSVKIEPQSRVLETGDDDDDETYCGQSVAEVGVARHTKITKSWYVVDFVYTQYGHHSGHRSSVRWAQLRDWKMLYLVEAFLQRVLCDQPNRHALASNFDRFCQLAATAEEQARSEGDDWGAEDGLNRTEEALWDALAFSKTCQPVRSDPISADFNHVADAVCRVTSDRLVSQGREEGTDGRHAGERVLLEGEWWDGGVDVDSDFTSMLLECIQGADICRDDKSRVYPVAKLEPVKRTMLQPVHPVNRHRERKASKIKPAGTVQEIDADDVLEVCRTRIRAALDRVSSDTDMPSSRHDTVPRSWLYRVETYRDIFYNVEFPTQEKHHGSFGHDLAIARTYDCRLLVGVARHYYGNFHVFVTLTHDIFWFAGAIMVDQDPSIWYLVYHLRFALVARFYLGRGLPPRFESLLALHFVLGMVVLTSVFCAVHASSSAVADPEDALISNARMWKQCLLLGGNLNCAVSSCIRELMEWHIDAEFDRLALRTIFSRTPAPIWHEFEVLRTGRHQAICPCPTTLYGKRPGAHLQVFFLAIGQPAHRSCKGQSDKANGGAIELRFLGREQE